MKTPVKRKIVVVGSLNVDFVARVRRLPQPGETITGWDFQVHPGGKGANQAFAAARVAGADTVVELIGRVGYDHFGDQLRASLAGAGVQVDHIGSSSKEHTGVALICVTDEGENAIVVVPGANGTLLPGAISGYQRIVEQAQCVLFQLEIPLQTVQRGLEFAKRAGVRTILDPAPGRTLDRELLKRVDILTPNETEACILVGQEPRKLSEGELPQMAEQLLELGCGAVIVTLGERGCYYRSVNEEYRLEAYRVPVKDSTAAGDAFNGALAVALSEGKSTLEALRFAMATAALSVTRVGAQSSMPCREDVEAFLGEEKLR